MLCDVDSQTTLWIQFPGGETPSCISARIVTYTARLQSLFLRPFAVICDVASRPAVIYAATIPESEKRRRVTNAEERKGSFEGIVHSCFYLPPVVRAKLFRKIVPGFSLTRRKVLLRCQAVQ